ncbi:OmpA family protein [Myroides odoratus]|uniref:OmpA family protein n=1 Tax=Myroides odoratus TaxID=256 RepID=UPI000765D087|nr:OmpA family protein [Myroides odoratus]
MGKNIKKLTLMSMLLIGGSIVGYSQIKKEKQADKSFNQMAYVDAIKVYESIANKGYVNTSILEKLADSYYFNGKLIEANKWYTELFDGHYQDKNLSELPSEYYYRYSQTLKSVGDYNKSQQMLDQFAIIENQDSRVDLYNKNRDYLTYIENHSDRYSVTLLDINSKYSDYGGTILDNKFVFTSSRSMNNDKNGIHSWNNESYTSLYESKIASNGFLEEPVLFAPEIDSKVNDATAVFTKDGKTMYFTRNNSKLSGNSKQNKENFSFLKLYKSVKQADGKWGLVEELPINSDNFNTAHPALTPDDKWLYFSSDRKGTLGQSDLYRVALYENGGYGPIENLGKVINTEGRENFPFISSDYQLYFSSDGHPGLGGMDVFVSKIYPDGSLGPVRNMGKPINSSLDDFGFYFEPKQGKGFVSSNRVGGNGSDDIYLVVENPCKKILEGKVYDKDTNEVLSNATVIISDALYEKSDTVYTNNSGNFITSHLECGHKYRIKVEKEFYNTVEVVLNINQEQENKIVSIGLEETKKLLTIEDDLFEKLELQPIHFDFNQSNIRKETAIELMKVLEVMKEYPTMKIDIRSYTDSRGSESYNKTLSNQRAQSTIKWMVDHGIDPMRLTGRGYGQRHLLNNCGKGVKCTEAEHEKNRRSEFIILEI